MCLALNFDLESWASKPFTRAYSEWERKLAVVVETMKVELASLMLLEFLMSDKYRMVSFKKKKRACRFATDLGHVSSGLTR